MNSYHVVNYHITDRCNYACRYCFGKFEGQKDPSLNEAKHIIESVGAYFSDNGIKGGRINFAGGEPMLYPALDELIDYTYALGMAVSIVTNGSLLTSERVNAWAGKVSCIGISVDSICDRTNNAIGRCCAKKTLDLDSLTVLAGNIHEGSMDLKINTVVSRFNIQEDLSPLYRVMAPQKIKLLQMHLIDGINDAAKPYEVTEKEFDQFCARHREFQSEIVAEPCGSMENSYLMINPKGELLINNHGTYEAIGDLKNTSFSELISRAPIDAKRFRARYQKKDGVE